MLPIGDDNSARRIVPYVTLVLIMINAIVFLLELNGGDAFVEQWAFIPAQFIANPLGEFITIFTSMFMHAGWLHLGGNMLYLWIFGDNVEDRLGHGLYLVFYILCGIAATMVQLIFSAQSNVPNVGASGAIAGVLGAYMLMFPRGRINVLVGRGVAAMSALTVIGFWILIQLFSGIGQITTSAQTDGGGVAYMAHIGGFFAGMLFTYLLGGTRKALPVDHYNRLDRM